MIWLGIIPLAVLLISVALLWFGLRGRRVDDHPICRKCGFDLFGRPPESNICSECGGDLRKRRAIRDGRRVRRRWMIAVGALLLAVALTVGGGAGYAMYAVSDWQQHKPLWWLMREIDGNVPATRAAALTELLFRQANSKLSQAEIDVVVEKMLDLQGDLKRPWDPGCGDFVEAERSVKRLSNPRWERYGRQSMQLTLVVRPWVRRGDVIPFQVRDSGASRVGARSQVRFKRPIDLAIDGEHFDGQALRLDDVVFARPASALYGSIASAKYGRRLRDGPQVVRVLLDLEMERSSSLGAQSTPMTAIELTAELKLFPEYESTVLVLRDDKYAAEMRKAIQVTSAAIANSNLLVTMIECKAPPAGLSHMVLASVDGHWHQLGVIACPPKETRMFQLSCATGLSDASICSVAFHPAPEAGTASVDTFEMWAGTLRYENVRLTRQK